MIIGDNKGIVINNIKESVKNQEYNKKVEIGDPNLTRKQEDEIIENYIENVDKISYKIKSKIAKGIISVATNVLNKETEIVGLECIKDINSGGIITSNHFNPLDNLIIQKFSKKIGKKLYIVSQVSNFAMNGFVGFMMKYANTIPLSKQIGYIKKYFSKIVKNVLKNDNLILIYPEEEMWFNYRKPRTLKPGAYYYAAKNNVPIISCFVEMQNEQEKDNEEFYKVKHTLHILQPIYPDSNKTAKENSIIMMEKDYKQKEEAYEKAYNKKLDYEFKQEDIAGWILTEN